MSDTKIYTPEVLPTTPFPQDPVVNTDPTSGEKSNTFTAPITPQVEFPQTQYAQELLSTSLNTRSKKILAQFTFTQQGAIQIGNFEDGQSGDIRISPNGIVGRNVNGETTFSIDGDTGDATFKGILQAKDFVIADDTGLISLSNFVSSNVTGSGDIGFITTSYTDVSPSTTMTFTLKRTAKVVILLAIQSAQEQVSGGSDMGGRVEYVVTIDGVTQDPPIVIDTGVSTVLGDTDQVKRSSYSVSTLKSLQAGTHSIKIQYRTANNINMRAHLYSWDLTYMVLGN